MRILLVLSPSGNLGVPNSKTWYRNFYEPLKDMGHDIIYLDIDNYYK